MRMKYGWGLMAGMLVIMFVLAIVGMSPMTALFSDGEGWELGMWGVMIIPLVGLLIMFAMMLFFFRRMKGGSPMPRKMEKGMESERPKLVASYKETESGVFDTQDIGEIQK